MLTPQDNEHQGADLLPQQTFLKGIGSPTSSRLLPQQEPGNFFSLEFRELMKLQISCHKKYQEIFLFLYP